MTEYTQLYFFQWTLVLRSLLLPSLEIELLYGNAGAETWSAVETWSVSQDLQPTRTEWDANCSRTIFFLTTGTRCIVKKEKKTRHIITKSDLDKWRFLQLPPHILTLVGLQDDAKCELSYRLPNHAMPISSHLGLGLRRSGLLTQNHCSLCSNRIVRMCFFHGTWNMIDQLVPKHL